MAQVPNPRFTFIYMYRVELLTAFHPGGFIGGAGALLLLLLLLLLLPAAPSERQETLPPFGCPSIAPKRPGSSHPLRPQGRHPRTPRSGRWKVSVRGDPPNGCGNGATDVGRTPPRHIPRLKGRGRGPGAVSFTQVDEKSPVGFNIMEPLCICAT